MDKAYAVIGYVLSPLVPLWLLWRWIIGKEDGHRLRERLGFATVARPQGTLLWIHAASVGEAASVLPMIKELRARWPQMRLLLTTGTRTSAALMQKRLPKGVIHQYVPVDTKDAAWRFMRHWRPDIGFFVESEFWPNLLFAARRWYCFLCVVNARMSVKSFSFWQKHPALITKMLSCFQMVFAQSEGDAQRLRALGVKNIDCVGNIKYDGEKLPYDESALLSLKNSIGSRLLWLAASTHPGEEAKIAAAHRLLAATRPDVLTIIIPRHPERGKTVAAELSKQLRTALRSRGDAVTPATQCYVADTLGEMGLFYRLGDIVFMGGSLVNHGGQNPLEPARLSCAVVTGPHTHNFADIYQDMEKSGACLRVSSAEDLAAQIGTLLGAAVKKQALQTAAAAWAESRSGATGRILDELGPLFFPPRNAA